MLGLNKGDDNTKKLYLDKIKKNQFILKSLTS